MTLTILLARLCYTAGLCINVALLLSYIYSSYCINTRSRQQVHATTKGS